MSHFFVPPKNFHGSRLFFDPPESRHIGTVLRKKSGDTLQVFDGTGATYFAKIVSDLNPDKIEAEIIEPAVAVLSTKTLYSIKLYPALCKSVNFEWMLQKVTELGVDSIQPIVTKRTIVSIHNDKSHLKLERWRKLILAASKQSGRAKLPEIFSPIGLEKALKTGGPNDLRIIPWEGESENHLSKIVSTWRSHLSTQPGHSVHIFIGPEGGFTLNEIRLALDSKFTTVRLTQNILRAETAAIAAISFFLLYDHVD